MEETFAFSFSCNFFFFFFQVKGPRHQGRYPWRTYWLTYFSNHKPGRSFRVHLIQWFSSSMCVQIIWGNLLKWQVLGNYPEYKKSESLGMSPQTLLIEQDPRLLLGQGILESSLRNCWSKTLTHVEVDIHRHATICSDNWQRSVTWSSLSVLASNVPNIQPYFWELFLCLNFSF